MCLLSVVRLQLVHQVEIWRERYGSNSLPSTLSSTLTRMSSFYSNIKAPVTILCTLPVTSCTAERSFSGLKRIKTVLRSSMSNERLSSLTLLHMRQDIPIYIEEVISGEFNFLTPLDSYLFIVLRHFFLVTFRMHI